VKHNIESPITKFHKNTDDKGILWEIDLGLPSAKDDVDGTVDDRFASSAPAPRLLQQLLLSSPAAPQREKMKKRNQEKKQSNEEEKRQQWWNNETGDVEMQPA